MLRWLKFNPTGRDIEKFKDIYDKTKSGMISLKYIKEIVNEKAMEPDTLEELIEAMKILDTSNDGTISVPELRWAMTQLGDAMDGPSCDDMIKEVDSDGKGFVDIMEFAKLSFAIKEKKSKD